VVAANPDQDRPTRRSKPRFSPWHWPGLTGEGIKPGIEWNLARTWHLPAPSGSTRLEVPGPLATRVLIWILGAFLGAGDRGCDPMRGRHGAACPHHSGLIPIRYSVIAETLLAHRGGSQRREIVDAIARLSTQPIFYRSFRPVVGGFRWPNHEEPLLSIQPWTDELAARLGCREYEVDVALELAEPLCDGLVAGRVQRLPPAMVQGLARSDLMIWLFLLCDIQVSRLKPDREVTFTVTDPNRARREIRPWQLGIRRSAPLYVAAALDRAVRLGNPLHPTIQLAVNGPNDSGRVCVTVQRVAPNVNSAAATVDSVGRRRVRLLRAI